MSNIKLQIENLLKEKNGMVKVDRDIMCARFLDLGANAINVAKQLEKTYTGRHISGQMIRAATSAGANYEEACGAESKADFLHKLQIVLKELRETIYWLKLIDKAELRESQNENGLLQKAEELAKIIAKSVVTAKANQ